MIEIVPRPATGRTFEAKRRVRVGDTGVDTALRPDAAARYVQDVARDDWKDTDPSDSGAWVVRRTTMRVVGEHRWPRLDEMVTLTTWCSGTGAAWAERRTDISVNGNVAVETAGLWVPVNATGQPTRLGPDFVDLYGVSAQGRKVSGRISKATTPTPKEKKAWPIRRADLDVVGHVNNAALWEILSEVVSGTFSWAELTHHDAVAFDDDLLLAWNEGSFWLSNGSQVKVSAEFSVD